MINVFNKFDDYGLSNKNRVLNKGKGCNALKVPVGLFRLLNKSIILH